MHRLQPCALPDLRGPILGQLRVDRVDWLPVHRDHRHRQPLVLEPVQQERVHAHPERHRLTHRDRGELEAVVDDFGLEKIVEPGAAAVGAGDADVLGPRLVDVDGAVDVVREARGAEADGAHGKVERRVELDGVDQELEARLALHVDGRREAAEGRRWRVAARRVRHHDRRAPRRRRRLFLLRLVDRVADLLPVWPRPPHPARRALAGHLLEKEHAESVLGGWPDRVVDARQRLRRLFGVGPEVGQRHRSARHQRREPARVDLVRARTQVHLPAIDHRRGAVFVDHDVVADVQLHPRDRRATKGVLPFQPHPHDPGQIPRDAADFGQQRPLDERFEPCEFDFFELPVRERRLVVDRWHFEQRGQRREVHVHADAVPGVRVPALPRSELVDARHRDLSRHHFLAPVQELVRAIAQLEPIHPHVMPTWHQIPRRALLGCGMLSIKVCQERAVDKDPSSILRGRTELVLVPLLDVHSPVEDNNDVLVEFQIRVVRTHCTYTSEVDLLHDYPALWNDPSVVVPPVWKVVFIIRDCVWSASQRTDSRTTHAIRVERESTHRKSTSTSRQRHRFDIFGAVLIEHRSQIMGGSALWCELSRSNSTGAVMISHSFLQQALRGCRGHPLERRGVFSQNAQLDQE
mmetsp:Transcript_40660/g.95591  ORF Transcript_40660/g.95591 Transcript_40660/m.95591 type:complete len:635 (+) Transcript_40660:297-2201(+)